MELLKTFPAYKTEILNLIFEGEPLKSIDAYTRCFINMNGDHPSRASVINFLELLEKSQYLQSTKHSGKGGYHKIWKLAISKDEALLKLSSDLNAEFIDKILSRLN